MKIFKGFLKLIPNDKRLPWFVWMGLYSQMIILWILLFQYHNKIAYPILNFTNSALKFLGPLFTLFVLCSRSPNSDQQLQMDFEKSLTEFAQGVGLWLAFLALSMAINREIGVKALEAVYLSMLCTWMTFFFMHALTKIILGLGGMVSTAAFKIKL